MPEDTAAHIARLQAEIAALRLALQPLAALPDLAAPFRQQLAAKEADLAALGGAAPPSPQVSFDSAQMGDVSMGDIAGHDVIGQQITGEANVGAAVAGNVERNLFAGETHGNNFAEVINIYAAGGAAPPADYEGALRRYLDDLYACHATLDLRGIDEQRPVEIPLTDLYISLTLREPALATLRGPGAVRRFMGTSGEPAPEAASALFDAEKAEERTVDWPEALRGHPRIAVVGRPGSGKTTLLHYTAVRLAEILARDENERLADLGLDRPLVPILLPLRDLGTYLPEYSARERSGNNPRLLLDGLTSFYQGRSLDLPADFFQRLCEEGRAILLLDGLDEVSRTDDREIVSGIVREFARRYPRCRYVVTARVAAYTGAAEVGAGFTICTVDDLADAQQQRFIANWSACVHRLMHPKASRATVERLATMFNDGLWTAIRENQGVGRLAPNPLLLTVIAIVYFDRQDLPENRAQLYEECVTVLLRGGRGKVDPSGKERAALLMSLEARRELLAAMAYQMHLGGEQHKLVGRDDLEQRIAAYLGPRSTDEREAADLARAFLKELPVHIGLLDEVEQHRFGFSHLSFQEFLAARYIAEQREAVWDELLDRYQESWWREVIVLCAGHMSQERSWLFLGKLITRGETPAARAAALDLATSALLELERFKGQGPIRGQIRDEALRILELQPAEASPAAARVRCGAVLARVGDPRPGVCDLPPLMVQIDGGGFVIGMSAEEVTDFTEQYLAEYREAGNTIDDDLDRNLRNHFQGWVNTVPVAVPPFELARYPVTNAQFKLFVDAGGYDPAAGWWSEPGRAWLHEPLPERKQDGWVRRSAKDAPEFWDDPDVGVVRPNHPVLGVSWYEVTAFCAWLTECQKDAYCYRLPSESEWEFAARGTEARPYAWGDAAPDNERANFRQNAGYTSAVGCFPAGATSGTGLLDMAGNVWEWTRSVYQPYPYNPTDGREDGTEPAQKYFTLRGGAWVNPPILLRAANRHGVTPVGLSNDVGFRLARHLKTVKPL
ncbi:SUMF1/EgtB/PvdO family nonheme iron enzyme [Oscillochloris sp. ZM17-4]|uniref:NACHT domain-containing protein n=1 Tax=Oscillochloris sp. ZM17-4 TaxID=2866714 RepID=UPI001C72D565|nr:SUMF1/EgtB/PvdO family nonheme iron enzyme [Oscillochloris sp. ZM17-4]MBX0330002.1 SUMF1/EgtB/PvdO family nonheme iron enzyme [Oscillochloris sp. ZM17-4]